MRRIVTSDVFHQLLSINGYFTIPLLSEEQIVVIKEIASNKIHIKPDLFYSTSFDENEEQKATMNKLLHELLMPTLSNVFHDFKVLGYNYLAKSAYSDYALPVHQDWTVTDETDFGSFTLWIPLENIVKKNGALRAIPGSHRFDNNHRAPSIPVAFEKIRSTLNGMLYTHSLNAGEAFVFNHKLMHASWENASENSRIALAIGVVHKDAQLKMLYKKPNESKVEVYNMPDDMFIRYPKIIDKPLIGEYQETIDYQITELSKSDLIQKFEHYLLHERKMKPLFKSTENQELFESQGYVKLPGLDQNAISELKKYFEASGIKNQGSYGFYVGMDNPNKSLVVEMMDVIKSIASPFITPYIDNYQVFTASFVNKDHDPKGIVPPHQDWSFVEDEIQHCSVTCWIPLQDVNMNNGCIGVIKGSNRYFEHVRPSPSPQTPSPLSKHMFSIFPMIQLIEMKAGEILIFDNKTIHASPPNVSNQTRLAVGLGFTQSDAKIRHHYLKPGTVDRILTYDIDASFFTKYDNGTLSKMYNQGKMIEGYTLLDESEFKVVDWKESYFKGRMIESGNEKNNELTNYLISNFKEQMTRGLIQKVKNFFKM